MAKLPELAEEQGNGTVITTGRLNVFPNGANVIPDKVVFTVDLRAGREEDVRGAIERTEALIASVRGDGIGATVERQLYIRPKKMSDRVRGLLEEGSRVLGAACRPMNSGAGHDAMVFSDFTDVGMLFISSRAGLSHCPEEWSDSGDIATAVEIFYEAAKKLTEAE